MKKLLYVAPHLSTGGLPQYLVKKVELLKQDFEIYLGGLYWRCFSSYKK